MGKRRTIRVIIVALSVLLAVSLVLLAGILIHGRITAGEPVSVVVPNNIITPEQDAAAADTSVPVDLTNGTTATAEKRATVLALYDKNAGDNTPFQAGNLFPGDAETRYYRVNVSYRDTVTVRFRADVRDGYEKLAEVLNCKVVLLTTGETLYDGLMRDMPVSVDHALTSNDSTTDELYYAITAYLDTGVGNEYQNRDLIADFRWWVEETGNLEPSPDTGVRSSAVLWMVAAGSFLLLIVLLFVKKRDREEGPDVQHP